MCIRDRYSIRGTKSSRHEEGVRPPPKLMCQVLGGGSDPPPSLDATGSGGVALSDVGKSCSTRGTCIIEERAAIHSRPVACAAGDGNGANREQHVHTYCDAEGTRKAVRTTTITNKEDYLSEPYLGEPWKTINSVG